MTSPQKYRLVGKIDPAHKEFTFTLGGIKGKNGNMLMVREDGLKVVTNINNIRRAK